MNLSEWRSPPGGSERRTNGAAELVSRGEMPPGNYLWLHPEARLTAAEREQLVRGLQASLR